MKVIPETHRVY